MEAILQALQNYTQGKQPLSPIPDYNVLNTAQKMNQYKTAQGQMQDMNSVYPNVNLNRDQFMNTSMQYGNSSPAQLANIAYQQNSDQSAKAALAQPTPQPTAMPTAIPTQVPQQNPIAQVVGNILKGAQNIDKVFKPDTQAQTPQDPYVIQAPIFEQRGIVPRVAFGIKQAEGGKNNPWDIGANDSNPNGAPVITDPKKQAEVAADAMRKLLDDQHITSKDPDVQLNALAKHFAGNQKDWKQRSIDEARRAGTHGAGEYFNSWADFVRSTPNWKKYAN